MIEEPKPRARWRLATSGGSEEFPYFFQGRLKQPRVTAQCLRVLAKVVGSRFHLPAAMRQRLLINSDPVVTSGGGLLRFEGFSACGSAYARLDLNPDAYDGVVAGHGTTNVDFNADMRAALAQIADTESVSFAIGTDDIALLRGSEQVIERKVPLPVRWLKGFAEVQAYQARMGKRLELGKLETLRFLRSLPRTVASRTPFCVLASGTGLRLSQQVKADGVKVAGLERLRLLEDLAPLADGLRVYADPLGELSEWELRFGPASFRLALSAEVWRGFSGEGQVLRALAGKPGGTLLERVRGMLHWQAELRLEEFTQNWDTSAAAIQQALAALGSRGLVGYDLARGAYFHRELPFDLGLVEELHPRLKSARKLVAGGGIRILARTPEGTEAEVPGSGVTHRVRIDGQGSRCTCPWHAKHQGRRGPCKHILAVQLLEGEPNES